MTFTAPCDRCGFPDARWRQEYASGYATPSTFHVDCPDCAVRDATALLRAGAHPGKALELLEAAA